MLHNNHKFSVADNNKHLFSSWVCGVQLFQAELSQAGPCPQCGCPAPVYGLVQPGAGWSWVASAYIIGAIWPCLMCLLSFQPASLCSFSWQSKGVKRKQTQSHKIFLPLAWIIFATGHSQVTRPSWVERLQDVCKKWGSVLHRGELMQVHTHY